MSADVVTFIYIIYDYSNSKNAVLATETCVAEEDYNRRLIIILLSYSDIERFTNTMHNICKCLFDFFELVYTVIVMDANQIFDI